MAPGRHPTSARKINIDQTSKIATWNVRTLHQKLKLENVTKEMDRGKLNILGLAEVRWTGTDRVVVAKTVAKPLNLGIIQVYAPRSDSEDVEVEKFYEEIEKAKDYLKSQDIIIIMVDFNAKVGDERVEDVVRPSGIGTEMSMEVG
ncbi:craniofacial development protein 2-like protein [Plakobranchus ocellatus]|uniref:Craniofacial development protein 2-like protein n=1 Tax=Plakobranchus ocellatus TaxID=259542 RepID=A0AAV3YTJ6_9GAST|nr:craniofacial development protein 2-like protein [Plakobranchus ocellatus]